MINMISTLSSASHDLADLKSGLNFSGLLVNCLKLKGRKHEVWKDKLGFNSSRHQNLFDEPYMEFFTNQFTEDFIKDMYAEQVALALRHAYISDLLNEKVKKEGVTQVVILGAGFDTRAQSYPFEKVKYYEVDAESVLTLKRNIYKEKNIKLNSKHIEINYIQEDLLRYLSDTGISFKEKTLFIWEGNSMYISPEEVNTLWNKIYKSFNSYFVVMDYSSKNAIAKKSQSQNSNKALETFSNMALNFINGYDNIQEEFGDINFLRLEQHYSIEELAKLYQLHDQELPDFKEYFLACFERKNIISMLE